MSNNGNGSYELWDIENCSEFNAINNALAGGADINDLTIKTVNRKSGDVMAPYYNCQTMYGEFVEFLFN